jgi:hypothetical protein
VIFLHQIFNVVLAAWMQFSCVIYRTKQSLQWYGYGQVVSVMACMCMHVCVWMYVCVCMCMHVCVCMYV